jgi:hypothetical protein
VHGEHDHARWNFQRLKLAEDLERAESGHGEVRDDDVGPQLIRRIHEGEAIGNAPDELELVLQEAAKAVGDDDVIIREQ